uniref:Uncharacterized protein n=1 Tax=Arundo donax TaxID=35708 RepID=A0A0A9FEH8_ARUDO
MSSTLALVMASARFMLLRYLCILQCYAKCSTAKFCQ